MAILKDSHLLECKDELCGQLNRLVQALARRATTTWRACRTGVRKARDRGRRMTKSRAEAGRMKMIAYITSRLRAAMPRLPPPPEGEMRQVLGCPRPPPQVPPPRIWQKLVKPEAYFLTAIATGH